MSELPAVARRFLRYVKYDTQSAEGSSTYPSTAKQLELSKQLVKELEELGLADVNLDEHGYVMATLEATAPGDVPVIGFLAHVDTSPEVSGADVNPQVHAGYDCGPIVLNDEYTLTPEESSELLDHEGHTIITTDGTTLLGADNKAGVAEIMTMVERLIADPGIKHGKIRIAFTVDEEIGTGTEHFDVEKFGADYAYTVDGEKPGEIENETFCADSAVISFVGMNVHPGYAKNKMVNSIKAASMFIDLLPRDKTPETTEGREGYLHPVSMSGDVEETIVKFILREFDEAPLLEQREILEKIRAQVLEVYPKVEINIEYSESYRNMRFILDDHPRVVDNAMEAAKRAGLDPFLNLIRGGTDGARLSFMGLPTPNIFTGGHLFHSRFEWISVEGMNAAVDTLVELVQVWAEPGK